MADPEKREHRNYPPLDFRIGCNCPACELAILLWYTEDESPARAVWQTFWDLFATDFADRLIEERRPCLWQYRAFSACEPRPKPTAYKIC